MSRKWYLIEQKKQYYAYELTKGQAQKLKAAGVKIGKPHKHFIDCFLAGLKAQT